MIIAMFVRCCYYGSKYSTLQIGCLPASPARVARVSKIASDNVTGTRRHLLFARQDVGCCKYDKCIEGSTKFRGKST